MKAEIEQIISRSVVAKVTIFDDGGTVVQDEDMPYLEVEMMGMDTAAAEIAKLCEADKWDAVKTQDAAWHSIEDQHLAQLAKMRQYAAHKYYCDIEIYGGETFEGMTVHCTCGLKQILAEIPPLEESDERRD